VNSNERISRDEGVDEGDFDLIALWHRLWNYRYSIALAAFLCGLAAAVLAFIETPIYRAEVAIIEARENNMSNAASLANQLGGLASLAGVNVGGVNGLGREAQAVLKSRHLVEEFIRRQNLIPELSRGEKKLPTLWHAVSHFKEGVLTIREEKAKGVTTVAIEWTDPRTAAHWANGFVALANELVRARALDDAKRNIVYLNDQIAQTNVVELQRVMYNIIENETKTLMLANSRADYAFTIVDPAVPPEVRSSPKRGLMIVGGVVLGSFLGAFMALFRSRPGRRSSVAPADSSS
jgi:uncharacterized protein involved in exopolysaccharide biosynthesis